MPFYPSPDCKFARNGLIDVIFELRFAPILRIDTELPTKFQEAIRTAFPYYEEQQEMQQEISIVNLNNPIVNTQAQKNHVFISEDKTYKIQLSRTRFIMSTSKYETFNAFIVKCREAILSFYEEYHPGVCTRVGLRYVNIFSRKDLGLTGTPWSELISTPYLSALGTHFADSVEGMHNVSIVQLSDGESKANIETALVTAQAEGDGSTELCFMLNSDFFCENNTSYIDAIKKAKYLNERATWLLHEVITDRLCETLVGWEGVK